MAILKVLNISTIKSLEQVDFTDLQVDLGTHRLDCWNRLVDFVQYELWSQSSRESRPILIIIQPMHKLVRKGQSFKGEFRVGADFIK